MLLNRHLLELSRPEESGIHLRVSSQKQMIDTQSLGIQVSTDFPLNIVIQPGIIEMYQPVLSYLLQLDKAMRCLIKTQMTLTRVRRVAMHQVRLDPMAYNLDQTDLQVENQIMHNLNWQTLQGVKSRFAQA